MSQGLKVLLVEDNNSKALSIIDGLHGTNKVTVVERATYRNAAIRKVYENQYDLIVLDRFFPGLEDETPSENAYMFLKRMKHRKIDTPVILCSSVSEGETLDSYLEWQNVVRVLNYKECNDYSCIFSEILKEMGR